MEKMKLVSLFSGAGGLDAGFVSAGDYKPILANDILNIALDTYNNNFHPHLVIPGSIEKLDFSLIRNEEVDVFIGGPPCQDFSVLRGSNQRKGTEVKRGRLYSHFVRGLIHVQPKIFVFENVPGLISANEGKAHEVISNDFENLKISWEDVKKSVGNYTNLTNSFGYKIMHNDIIDFKKIGLPQIRRRLIIIGLRKDLVDNINDAELSRLQAKLSSFLHGTGKLFEKFPLTPIEVFEGKPLDHLDDEYKNIMREYDDIWSEVKTEKAYNWKKKTWDKLTFDIEKDYIEFNNIKSKKNFKKAMEEHEILLKELKYYDKSLRNMKFEDNSDEIQSEAKTTSERMRRIPPWENHEFVRGTEWEVKGLMSNIYRRIHPLFPSPTVIAYGGGGTWGYHYERTRGKLTNRERARLQTFSDDFLFSGGVSEIRAQIGEAVPPLAGKRIAQEVKSILHKI